MTRRYREALDRVDVGGASAPVAGTSGAGGQDTPVAFQWRGQTYEVLQVLGHWREDPGWWRRPDGQPIRIEQTDLWRVEAGHGVGPGRSRSNGVPTRGVYELVRRNDTWTLDRVWD